VPALRPRGDEWLAHDFALAVVRSAEEGCGPRPVIMATGEFVGLPLLYMALVEGCDVVAFAPGTSDPSVIGATGPVESLEEALAVAGRTYGTSSIAVLAGGKAAAMGGSDRICGLVYTLETPPGRCRSPRDYPVRGVGGEMRDYYSRVLSAEYLLHLARWDMGRGEADSARAVLERLVPLVEDDAHTNVEASRLYFELGDAGRAEDLLRVAVAAEPDYFYAHFALANVYSMDGRHEEAISEYERALVGNPDPGVVLVDMGNAYRAMGDYARSVEYYEKALALDEAGLAANLGMGTTLEAMGKTAEALAHYERALEADPTYAPAVHAKAALLMRLGRNEESARLLEAALTSGADDPLLLSDMGLYYLRTARLDSAVVYLERALEAAPALLTARGNLAVAYERKGMKAKAAEHYRRYIEDSPPGPGRQRAAEALRAIGE